MWLICLYSRQVLVGDHLSMAYSVHKAFGPVDVDRFPETLVSTYQYTLRQNPEKQRHHFYRRENLKYWSYRITPCHLSATAYSI
jgi:hypothetical protein